MSARPLPNQRTGRVAGVPYAALPPEGDPGAAPLVVGWHMMDFPRSAAEMAAALPLAGRPPGGCSSTCRCTGHALPTTSSASWAKRSPTRC